MKNNFKDLKIAILPMAFLLNSFPTTIIAQTYQGSPLADQTGVVHQRQWKMDRRHDAMTQLNLMLRKQIGFDRAKAINLAQQLKASSADSLIHDFRPESVNSYDTNLNNNFLSNQATFQANATALEQTTQTLINELKKVPTKEQGAIFLPKHMNPFDTFGKDTVAVSPSVWGAYQAVAIVCDNCHQAFRR